jgi:translation initiation factor IF-1
LILRTGAPATSAGSALSMESKKAIELEGKIISVLAHISGKMRKRFIRLTAGDRVKLQMSPYDIEKARIIYRLG